MRNGTTTFVGIIVIIGCLQYMVKADFYASANERSDYETEEFSKSGSTYIWENHFVETVDDEECVAIKAINGSIDVQPNPDSDANEVVVDATIKIRKGSLWSNENTVLTTKEKVGVLVERKGDTLVFRTDQPKRTPMGIKSISIDFKAKVPRWMIAQLESVNGKVSANGLETDVKVSTVNGRVEAVHCVGPVYASTVNGTVDLSDVDRVAKGEAVNGSVKVAFAKAPQSSSDFSSVNGSLSIVLPKDANLDLQCDTVNGRIQLGNVRFSGTQKKHHISGKINQGGPRMKLHTINGGVSISQK